jgi:SMP-30/Gluconolactonase/LRE-like region
MYHFNPPKVIEAEVFMRLPDHLRRDKAADLTPWARQQHPGVPVAAFLEGPSFDRNGDLYCVDIAHVRIFRTTPTGEVSVVTEYDGEPNGLKIHKDRRVFVADYKNGIVTVDPATGKVTPLLDRASFERFRGVNDLTFARTVICISPTRARPACTIRPAACIACAPTVRSTASWTMCRRQMAWCSMPVRTSSISQ